MQDDEALDALVDLLAEIAAQRIFEGKNNAIESNPDVRRKPSRTRAPAVFRSARDRHKAGR
jgi:hypothetical protein